MLSDDIGVLFHGNASVRVSADVKDWNMGCGNGCEDIDRIAGEVEHLLLAGEVIGLDGLFPVAGAAYPFSFATRPALHIAHRSVSVDTSDFVCIYIGPAVRVETSTAESFQGWFGSEVELPGDDCIENIKMLHRFRSTKSVPYIDKSDMKARFEKREIYSGEGVPEHRSPHPWTALQWLLRYDHQTFTAFNNKGLKQEAVIVPCHS